MKKLVAMLLSLMMLLVCVGAYAEAPEGYPEIVPGIDFGGQQIYIYDFWTASAERVAEPTDEQQAQYDYRDWLEATYNCKITQIQKGDWTSSISEFINFTTAPDGSLCLFILPQDHVTSPMNNDLFAAWDAEIVDFSDEKWNDAAVGFMTKGGKILGVASGKNEPRNCLFFNKRVLEEAGIDWNTIYDMQAEGTWTWDALEVMLQQITKDVDNDGVIDIYGMTGDNSQLYMMGVASNGADFFDFNEAGEIEIAVNSDEAIEGLQWAKDIWSTYFYQQPADGNWDYFKESWKQGFCGFYVYNTYGGFNDGSEMADMADEWGCVAFPMGPNGETYVHIANDNITVIPNVYDDETVSKLSFIYDMWSNATPGYDDEFGWIGNKYNFTDERAVDETYAMLREAEHTVINHALRLGSVNDVLGSPLLWQIAWNAPADLIDAATPAWQALCDAYNGK